MYGPPPSDSDSDYEGFSFNFARSSEPRNPLPIDDSAEEERQVQLFRQALKFGDVEQVQRFLNEHRMPLNQPLANHWTPLLYACQGAQWECIKLLLIYGAEIQVACNEVTCLMAACDSPASDEEVLEVVTNLLARGVDPNRQDYRGRTALMYACCRGFLKVVKLLVSHVYLDAVDSAGWSALFHAIDCNHLDIVRLLIEVEVNVDIVDKRGYTAINVAQMKGFQDIVNLFPKSGSFVVPKEFLYYSDYKELLPEESGQSPTYYPDIPELLYGCGAEQLLPHFVKARVSLLDFLTLTDARLQEIGIEMPYQRKKILHGIYRFHSKSWKKTSLNLVNVKNEMDTLDLYRVTTTQLKHLTVLLAGAYHIHNNIYGHKWRRPVRENIAALRRGIVEYRKHVIILKDMMQFYLNEMPRPPSMYIDYEDAKRSRLARHRKRICIYAAATTIGVGILVRMWRN